MITIRCIEGILLEGGLKPIMKGEMFKLIDYDNNEFEGIEGKSINPGMVLCFYDHQLQHNFEFVVGD